MIKRRTAAARLAAVDVLRHVPGDGDHGLTSRTGEPRARAADRGSRVAEDDEALRNDSFYDRTASASRFDRDFSGRTSGVGKNGMCLGGCK